MNKQPLLILVISFILGIFFQEHFSLKLTVIYAVIGICFLVLISTFTKIYFFYKIKSYLLMGLFFITGIVLHYYNTFSSEHLMVSSNESIVFKIAKKLNSGEKNKKYEIVAQAGNKNFNAVLYIPKDSKELDFNNYYKASAYIVKPQSPQYDFQFDYAQYLKRKNIEYQCFVNEEIAHAPRNDLNLSEIILQERMNVLHKIDQSQLSPRTREFLKGIILADRTEIDSVTVQDFNRSGLVHFLAISGTHIVVIFGLIYFLLITILPLKFRKYAIVSSLVFIWLFTVFIGFGSSVVRSSIMLSIYFIYVLLQRKPDLLHSLSLAAFIILIFDTQQIYDVGFQLSFLAVLGIFWLNQPILNLFPAQNSWWKKLIFNTVSISISAQLATLPLVLYYFHQFSLISVVANFIIVPFSEVIIVFSFLMTALIAFGLDFTFIDIIYDFIIEVLLNVIHWFADFEVLFFENIPMNLTEVFCLFVIAYLLKFTVEKFKFRNISRLTIAVFAFFIIKTGSDIVENHQDEILIHNFYKHKLFSVKKGNRAVFWITDNADQKKISQYIINPYISSKRLKKIEVKTFPDNAQKVVHNGRIYSIK